MPTSVRIIRRNDVFKQHIFRIEEAVLRHERYDGSMSKEITRLVFHRGDSVAILLHDEERDKIMFTEQFRYPTYEKGPGWLLELPAGVVENGESEKSCARREVLEETGYRARRLKSIATVYPSPGGCSERIHICYASVTLGDKILQGGGIEEEGEDIRVVMLCAKDAFAMAKKGQILDAKTLIALQWLALNRRRSAKSK